MAFLLEKHSHIAGFTIYRVDRTATGLNSNFESDKTISAKSELDKSRYEARKKMRIDVVSHDKLRKQKEKKNGVAKF